MEWWQWILSILLGIVGCIVLLWGTWLAIVSLPRRRNDEWEQRGEFYFAWGVILPIGALILFTAMAWWGAVLTMAHVTLTLAVCALGLYMCSVASEDKVRVNEIPELSKKERWGHRKHILVPGIVILMGALCLPMMFGMMLMPGGLPFSWWMTLATVVVVVIVMVVAHRRGSKSKVFRYLVAPCLIVLMFSTLAGTLPAILREADKATTNETEVVAPKNFYEETEGEVSCAQDSPYYQWGADMAAEAPADEKLAADASLLAEAAKDVLDRNVDAASLVDGDCLNPVGVDLYKELISEVDVIADLEDLVSKAPN